MITIDGVVMVDVREAATLARRTPETIRRWVWTSRVSSVKHGNRLLVPREDVMAIVGPVYDEADDAVPTLAAWAGEVDRTLAGGMRNGSARDLVLADREARV